MACRENVSGRTGRPAGVALVFALLLVLVLGGIAHAQESGSAELALTPSRESGVGGVATLTDVEGGVRVELSVRGLPEEGVEHINHIHGGGTCADDRAGRTAPVTIPLTTVVANADGTGSATTTIGDVTVAELFDEGEERFILLHAETKEGEGVPPGISCADLVRTSGSAVTGTLPESGGPHLVALALVGLALALLGYVACVPRPGRR